jgi:1,4-dihydroxy-2-naphthoate octaprenyltransferase
MRSTPALDARQGLEKLASYPFAVLTFVDPDGYPLSAAVSATTDLGTGTVRFAWPAGLPPAVEGSLVSLTGSHIRPQPGYGYDERRHVTVWGRVASVEGSPLVPGGNPLVGLTAEQAWGWDEAEVPFFEYSERSVGRARRYFDALSMERGTPVRPRLSFGWLTLRATRLPFLSATILPVVLGILIAAAHGAFDAVAAVLTVVGASLAHLAVNVSNDVFDDSLGADDANVTPTKFSGGSRVIQYGLLSRARMARISGLLFVAAAAVGVILFVLRGSPALVAIAVAGLIVGLGYTAPPLKLVYRGLGEIAVAIAFGPLLLLGAYVVQTGGALAWEPLVASIPHAMLVALILYVNEIPDRRGDAHAGKRTLPVRLPKATVIRIYEVVAVVAFASVVAGVLAGILPLPALVILLAAPMALRVRDQLGPNYENPYGLMAVMGENVAVHTRAGLLLIAAYAIVLLVAAVAPSVDLFLG